MTPLAKSVGGSTKVWDEHKIVLTITSQRIVSPDGAHIIWLSFKGANIEAITAVSW